MGAQQSTTQQWIKHQADPTSTNDTPPENGLTTPQVVFAIIKVIIGPAILYLPHGFLQAGYGFAIFMMWLSWAMFNWNVARMLDVWRIKHTSYAEMMGSAFGSRGQLAVQLFVVLQQCGVCCTYFVFIAKNLNSITGWDKRICVFVQLAFHVPLSWMRDIKTFRYINMASSGMVAICIAILLSTAITDDIKHPKSMQLFNSNKFYEFVGTATFAWEGMAALAIPLQGNADCHTRPLYGNIFVKTTAAIMLIYTLFALSNLTAYGEDVETDLPNNLQSSVLRRLVQVTYSVAVVLTFPLQLHEGVHMASAMLGATRATTASVQQDSGEDSWGTWILGTLARTGLVLALAVLSAVLVNDLGLFVSIIGSLIGVPLTFIFPAMIHWKLIKPTGFTAKVHFVVIGAGILMCIASTSITLYTA